MSGAERASSTDKVDEILEKFENLLGTARTEDDKDYRNMYKNWGRYGNQEERRNEILRQQKSNRENKLDSNRGILSMVEKAEEIQVFNKSPRAKFTPNVFVPGFSNKANYYRNVLMLSEWMVEKPEDFSTNWYVTICPKGTRTLAVACNGSTKFFTKYGQLIFTTSTLLPGGNANEARKNCCVLDCFYYKDTNTMYVLDILLWNSHIMADGEMEFRHYWLRSKFDEHPALEKLSKRNKVIFNLLPMISCDVDSLQQFMMTYPPLMLAKLDGFLFYHKHANYVAGETPLMGWLYPYMVPEVLCPDMTIHESYASGKPSDYVDQATYIQKFEEKFKKKRTPFTKRNKKRESVSVSSMEADDGPAEQDTGEKAKPDDLENAANEEMMTTENATCQEGNTATMESENDDDVKKERGEELSKNIMSILNSQDSAQQQVVITKY